MADREGRLEYRPKRIKAELLPYDNCNIEKMLMALSKDFITLYEADGNKYIEINKFTEHQNCHIKEQASTIPAPCKTGASMEVAGPLSPFPLPLTDSPLPLVASSDLQDHSQPEPFILIPLNDKTTFSVFTPLIDEWRNLFPKVDIEQELRNIRAWNLSNPKLRKTKAGILKHITQWLAKEQNRGGNGNNGNAGTPKIYARQDKAISTRQREIDAEADRLSQEYYALEAKNSAADGKT